MMYKLLLIIFFLFTFQSESQSGVRYKSITVNGSSYGYELDKSCIEQFSNISNIVNQTMVEGLRCLNDLKETVNMKRLQSLFTKKKVRIICSLTPIKGWEYDNVARASEGQGYVSSEFSNTSRVKLTAPFIVLNIELLNIELSPRSKEKKDQFFKNVIFHEFFHNIYYVHGRDIEYPYTCAECCFNREKEHSKSSCDVCSGTYKSIKDKGYFRKINPSLEIPDKTKNRIRDRILNLLH